MTGLGFNVKDNPPPSYIKKLPALPVCWEKKSEEIHACIDLKKKKNSRKKRRCKQRKREIIWSGELYNLPLRQLHQHKVIKSDSFACYFSDDIYPSFSMHLHSLLTCQSLHPSHIPPVPRLSRKWNQLSHQYFFLILRALDPVAF